MKLQITLEPTDQLQMFEGVEYRLWKGTVTGTDVRPVIGVEVHALIKCVSPQTHDEQANALFAKVLRELPPVRRELVSFDMRMV